MKVGCYQCSCKPGDFEANLRTVHDGLELAEEAGVEILALPESLLTGYYTEEADARAHAFAADGPEIHRVLKETAKYSATFMVGFNELRGPDIFNTVLVAERGKLLGAYSKAFPVMSYFRPGRSFPVFERSGMKFGVIICADGAYIEPARILALKGARIIFAPHYNWLVPSWVVVHYYMVRHDHVARAIENGVWFLRANTVGGPGDKESLGYDGVGYGDSYLLDPLGQVAAHAGLHCERLMVGTVDLERNFYVPHAQNSRASGTELGDLLREALNLQGDA